MADSARKIDRSKILTGVALLCAAVLLMLMEKEEGVPVLKGIWMSLLGAGLFLYLWGRFFSRGKRE